MTQIIKNARQINGETVDIAVKDGIIQEITEKYAGDGVEIKPGEDVYISPGWIDLHTHAFPKYEPYCAEPDEIGFRTGVTTIIDAGSSGADDIDEFYEIAQQAKTRVLSLLNISRSGLRHLNELADLSTISLPAIEAAVEKHPDFIVGLKARMSASVVEMNDIKPLQLAKQLRLKKPLPMMVHIGSGPPAIGEVLDVLEAGDVVTHCFHQKQDNHIFATPEAVHPALLRAMKRGVHLDVGHGTSSFSFPIAKQAKEAGIAFDTIGTDIYQRNQLHGPVYDMATTLTKFLALGHSLQEIIWAVTGAPAAIIGRDDLGVLREGCPADATFFTVEKKPMQLMDSYGHTMESPFSIKVKAVMIGGEYIELETSN